MGFQSIGYQKWPSNVWTAPPPLKAGGTLPILPLIMYHLLSLALVKHPEHLVLSVCCFPSYRLLIPLMTPKGKKCKLIDCKVCM